MLRLPAEWRCLHPRYCFSVCTCVGWVSRSRFLRAALAIARADFRSALCLRLFAVFRRQTVGEHGGMRWPGRVGFAAVQGPLRLHRSARGWAPCAAVEATTGHALQAADGGSDAPSRTWKHNASSHADTWPCIPGLPQAEPGRASDSRCVFACGLRSLISAEVSGKLRSACFRTSILLHVRSPCRVPSKMCDLCD